jgi:DNA polymerase I-like protein with 3'-5' exonuclease and polymerase domains
VPITKFDISELLLLNSAMNDSIPFFQLFFNACIIEQFLYFEIIKDNIYINVLQESKLDIIIYGMKGTKIEFRLNSRNTNTYINFINKVLEKNNKPIVFIDAKIFQLFCRKNNSIGISYKQIYDILWYKKYIGIKDENKFENFKQICETFRDFLTSNVLEIYKSIFQKLICVSLPKIENTFLVNDLTAEKIYPHYIVEGQDNGRLNTKIFGSKSYNPNTLDDEKKNILINPYEDEAFVVFDYRSMEASVLAGLSKDGKLSTVINSCADPYEQIAKYVLNIDNFNSRVLGKEIFLPVIYGISASTLAEKNHISVEQAKVYISSLRLNFSASFEYMDKAYQQAAQTGLVDDCFGRIRIFKPDESFKAKNFVVQSPAATINQLILNRLIENQNKIGFRVFYINHDAYCLSVKKSQVKKKFYEIKDLLEQKIDQAPDVILFAEGKVGNKLNQLIKINKTS